ncbi:MAG TPA: o-succinylbenzoate synthase [Actinomycetales bacterium]|nr:o-succinylbenzoate synthase [Actinomycetales bacterium]
MIPDLAEVDAPDLPDLRSRAHVVALPLRTRFRGVDVREVLLLEGPVGWGEFAPFTEYGDSEAASWLAAAVESAWVGWPAPVRRSVPVNATVPAVGPEAVEGVLARFDGCRTAKVKVAERGQSLEDDVTRVAEVRRLLGAGARIRVDANGAWDFGTAVEALTALAKYDLEYAEQPCATVGELAELRVALARAGVNVLVAADESIRKADDPFAVAAAGAADVAVVKVPPLGGVRRALAVAERLQQEHGLPVVVSSALDSSVGIAAGLALAAALPELPFACGLGTAGLLAADVTTEPLLPVDGWLPVGPIEPDRQLLSRYAASPDRRDWWLDRLVRCQALLAGSRP